MYSKNLALDVTELSFNSLSKNSRLKNQQSCVFSTPGIRFSLLNCKVKNTLLPSPLSPIYRMKIESSFTQYPRNTLLAPQLKGGKINLQICLNVLKRKPQLKEFLRVRWLCFIKQATQIKYNTTIYVAGIRYDHYRDRNINICVCLASLYKEHQIPLSFDQKSQLRSTVL